MRIADAVVERFGVAGWKLALLAVLMACALWPVGLAMSGMSNEAAAPHRGTSQTEWPREWQGRLLRPLALSAVEQRFAEQFPGRIMRLTDGEQTLVWREVDVPTRMLHPAADCYRGLGYRIEQAQLERDREGLLWRCFIAERNGRRVRVCERIVDAKGESFTDTSSWFWATQLGRSTGPWQAITTARML
jgi:hypothetical protein